MSGRLEDPAHEVLATHDGFEVRRYAPTVQARVQKARPGQGSDGSAFRRVAGYIFGGNDAGMRIAMTAPVQLWGDGSRPGVNARKPDRLKDQRTILSAWTWTRPRITRIFSGC